MRVLLPFINCLKKERKRLDSFRYEAYPIHNAVKRGNIDNVLQLIGVDSDVNIIDNDGNTPLVYAVIKGHIDITNALLFYGADSNFTSPQTGLSILQTAMEHNNTQIVNNLLNRGVDVNFKEMHNGNSALHLASYNGDKMLCQLLIKYDADTMLQNNDGDTPKDIGIIELENLHSLHYIL